MNFLCPLVNHQFLQYVYISDMKIEVSNGEIIDKLTILEIKLEKIDDPPKLLNIKREYDILLPLAAKIVNLDHKLVEELRIINSELWEIEDNIRDKDRSNNFGPDFIDLARKVYKKNDIRAKLKSDINGLTGSHLSEEKSYKDY